MKDFSDAVFTPDVIELMTAAHGVRGFTTSKTKSNQAVALRCRPATLKWAGHGTD